MYILPYCPPKMSSGNSGKIASPLDFNPSYPHYWSTDSRDAIFGAHLDAFEGNSCPNALDSQCAIPSMATIPFILALDMPSTQPSSVLGQLFCTMIACSGTLPAPILCDALCGLFRHPASTNFL